MNKNTKTLQCKYFRCYHVTCSNPSLFRTNWNASWTQFIHINDVTKTKNWELLLIFYQMILTWTSPGWLNCLEESNYYQNYEELTLFAPEGGLAYMLPCHVFAYICANIHTSALKKTWLVPIISLEKGSALFTP